jgi:hypothetical protein
MTSATHTGAQDPTKVTLTAGWSVGSMAHLRARLSELEAERIFAPQLG